MPPRKRAQADAATPATGSYSRERRRSQRVRSSATKSAYFEAESDADDGSDVALPPPRGKKAPPKEKGKVKEEVRYDEDGEDEYESGDDDGGYENDDELSPEAPPNKKRRGRPHKQQQAEKKQKTNRQGSKASAAKAKRRETDDDDDDDEGSEDEDGRVTFIPLPQLRDTGGVDYDDARLHRNTLLFLRDLKANNKRSWLKMHDPEYRRSLKDWESFVETLTERIAEADDTIPELPLKDVIFRIYRDIRFTKDPTPYKAHYSAAWSRTGRKGPYACYYVHVEPGGRSMVGGGLWHPDNGALARLRASIDERPHRLRRVLLDPAFRRTFLPGAKAGDERSAIAAFVAANQENALKTRPKGFHPEHRDLELLKLRNFTIGRKIDDSVLTSEDAQDKIMAIITPMVPFITFLNSVVMPDPNLDSDSDGEENDDEGNDDEAHDNDDDDGEDG
ncbi:hypothetical protein DL766_001177 [Monosporascus sp. MC13-8B]|uniref:TIGR02453 family protein n=1 Tax=Monosporascus cannonballus TaxID=155416 RepID=A0ABY0HD38_9PEZI|nr:hypothetical protein DL762_002690 [Monosporascus cannonballus]RYP38098.1 hypothetical protein DL766_001177 [Monosporascus sp. MC13-8B]